MRLLLHDTLVTAPLVAPLTSGWIEPATGVSVEVATTLTAGDVGSDDVALVPLSELGGLQQSHRVLPDVAVVADGIGAVSLRTPVRPDEVERTPVRILGSSAVAELLARATLRPYFGIQATAWVSDQEEPTAEAVVLEGTAALHPIEGGFAEDLSRAWFILTGLPVVSHLLVAPVDATRPELRAVLDTMRLAMAVGHERRREWRDALIDQSGLDRARFLALLAGQRYELTTQDRQALTSLYLRGSRGSAYPPLTSLRFLEPDPITQ